MLAIWSATNENRREKWTMTTARDIYGPSGLAANAAVDAPRTDPLPDDTDATAGASQPQNEAMMRARGALPPDTMILAPAFTPPPMRRPDGVWAMLVTAVDIIGDTDSDSGEEVALFAGQWVSDKPPADDFYDGDLVVRLTDPIDSTYQSPREHVADVEMLQNG
ncbi:hypothetical protein [Amycolatopsis sp. PS_44_ISF1]|uniref:hypothetical protein n=1 Tax=Amycolatopsis sp. PS_44_ISF1 TaxID=2974917 RepID=UPI0028DEEC96|nr:hypothetical protein [Amycolatopsis sp. PS_44_ISF1]MDT8916056.1 hypothetical protein [Amycolatopsis sp. PS_44_ISF1]